MKKSRGIINQWACSLRLLPLAILLAVLASTVFPRSDVRAAGIDVDLATDTVDPNDGQCSLREAITAANTNNSSGEAVGECPGGEANSPDTINLTASATYNLTNGQLTVNSEIILNGNKATISAGGLSRILVVETGGNLSLYDVTLRDGVGDEGGAIHSRSGSTVNIFNSAILDNAAIDTASSSGGGINNWGGTVNITNSTISGNRANAGGGGIANLTFYAPPNLIYGAVNLTHVTLTNNTADAQSTNQTGRDGGGIFNFGMLTIKDSIIAGNLDNSSAPDEVQPDCANWLYLTSGQYNLIGSNTGCDIEYPAGEPASYFPPGAPNFNNDFVGTNDNLIDPMLGPLTGNPAYHPLLKNSPAINKIPTENCPVNRDQPGTVRPQDSHCDIGAVEAVTAVDTDMKITIIKETGAPVDRSFYFTSTIPYSESFSLKGSGNGQDDRITFSNLMTGSYTIAEIVPPKWVLLSISCDNGATLPQPNPTGITINLQAGQQVECTFTNNRPNLAMLDSIEAVVTDGQVEIWWTILSEVGTIGYNVMRSTSITGTFAPINKALVLAEGDSFSGATYSYIDTDMPDEVTYYFIQELDINGIIDHNDQPWLIVSTAPEDPSIDTGGGYIYYLPLIFKSSQSLSP